VTHAGRIGPNAVTRLAEVLPARVGVEATRRLFERAGLLHFLQTPPQQLVDETEVARLHRELRQSFGGELAATLAREAGRRTADYLLAHRIPKPAQALLTRLPAALAARALVAAIRRHAWTFAGSGEFSVAGWRPLTLQIRGNPLARGLATQTPACHFYAATFEHLFRTLVAARTRVREVACEACGDDACRFELRW